MPPVPRDSETALAAPHQRLPTTTPSCYFNLNVSFQADPDHQLQILLSLEITGLQFLIDRTFNLLILYLNDE